MSLLATIKVVGVITLIVGLIVGGAMMLCHALVNRPRP
jgi:hypothetical protein